VEECINYGCPPNTTLGTPCEDDKCYTGRDESHLVTGYLPAGETAGTLIADLCPGEDKGGNPCETSMGVLGGQLVAAMLNVKFSDDPLCTDMVNPACVTNATDLACTIKLGDLCYRNNVACTPPDWTVGMKVRDVVAACASFVGGDCGATLPAGIDAATCNEALDMLNNAFDNCGDGNAVHSQDSQKCFWKCP